MTELTINDGNIPLRPVGGGLKSGTPAELRTLINVEDGATADQTGAEIKTAYEAEADTNAFTDAEKTKLSGIETAADVTDATNVNAAGAVMESDFDANTILHAISDNTPVPLSIGASTILARLAAGNLVAATPAQLRTLINVEDGATADQTTEEIQDIAGPLVATGGTKTGIAITYQDATGDMDFVVDDLAIELTTFTRLGSATAVTVTQAGLAGQPIAAIFFMGNATTFAEGSHGFSDATTDYCVQNVAGFSIPETDKVIAWDDGGLGTSMQKAEVASFTSDGWILHWTVTGTPAAETLRIFALTIHKPS